MKDNLHGWEEFARKNNLTFSKGLITSRPKVTGVYRNRALKLETYSVHSGYSAQGNPDSPYTRVTISSKSKVRLQVKTHGMLDQMLDTKEVEIGSETFKHKYQVSANAPDKVHAILTAAVQSAILENKVNWMKLDYGSLALRVAGVETHPQTLTALCNLACNVAQLAE